MTDEEIQLAEFEVLIEDSVKQILAHEDRQRFFAWVHNYLVDAFKVTTMAPFDLTEIKSLATNVAMTIWNAMPLPGNGFRPRPLPVVGRNEPCPCNSGKKYKKCCFIANTPPPITTEQIWPVVIEQLPAARLQQALREGRIPLAAVGGAIYDGLYADKPKKRAQLLEPFLQGDMANTGRDAAAAFDQLMDAYGELGHWRKKEELVSRLLEKLPASPLRSAVYQRQATMLMDRGDTAAAWESYKKAMHDAPNDLVLGGLEIQLHLAEGHMEQARQSARIWLARARKQGLDGDDPAVQLFEAAKEDPLALFARYEADMGGDGDLLLDWVAEAGRRPLPAYRIETICEDEEVFPEGEEEEADFVPLSSGSESVLVPPQQIAKLEGRWAKVFPLEKPFSIHAAGPEAEECWLGLDDEWLDFLGRNPACADSLSIIDDLLSALEYHPAVGGPGWGHKLFLPLLQRAREIVVKAMAASPEPVVFPWVHLENRPALRSLFRLAMYHDEKGKRREFMAAAEELVRLNPADNHGIRALLMNAYLQAGKDTEAMTLARQYPNDLFPETVFGNILVLFRAGNLEEAAKALAGALKRHGKVVRYLTASRIRQPELHPMGFSLGGEDQAWHYREKMRPTWQQVPGALEWLKRQGKT